jgi:hypothetical protein
MYADRAVALKIELRAEFYQARVQRGRDVLCGPFR